MIVPHNLEYIRREMPAEDQLTIIVLTPNLEDLEKLSTNRSSIMKPQEQIK